MKKSKFDERFRFYSIVGRSENGLTLGFRIRWIVL